MLSAETAESYQAHHVETMEKFKKYTYVSH
jgi:hypothetical protein